MSLEDAIKRNRERQAAKQDAILTGRHDLRAFTVNVLVIPPTIECAIYGSLPYEEKRTIYGTSLKDAKKRAGID